MKAIEDSEEIIDMSMLSRNVTFRFKGSSDLKITRENALVEYYWLKISWV